MNDIKGHLQDIKEIRSIMEDSTKVLSLSGLSGVVAGLCALVGAAVAWWYMGSLVYGNELMMPDNASRWVFGNQFMWFFFADAGMVLVSALVLSSFFSSRLAKRKGYPIWNKAAKSLVINLLLPLVAGGIFILIQLYHGLHGWVAGTTLIFYGLAVINGGKYTVREIRLLGISEVVLGLLACLFVGYGLVFWSIGFGLLHIVYGIMMYLKYER